MGQEGHLGRIQVRPIPHPEKTPSPTIFSVFRRSMLPEEAWIPLRLNIGRSPGLSTFQVRASWPPLSSPERLTMRGCRGGVPP